MNLRFVLAGLLTAPLWAQPAAPRLENSARIDQLVQDGKLRTLDWNALSQDRGAGIEYGFKYFQQVSGTIMLPDGFAANRVVVRADGDGDRVDQDFSWKDAMKGEESDDVRQ